ncbi:hypothetical protein BST81_14390 [Leptolyngbya sp. 'hensonii']|uniref:serine/threonine-protein kinase n=1 Tax=Leptolyngbya sp. 'hensonii' TaxID=1922337 RepID=UPI00094FF149|nr:serine/threonine-protein kinase [Leptolyngbya sp. 'hensonii']OLP17525.1 hypothetical protein BST81_14390 [Leptolyngbya sp. 'hensonii']
MQPPIPNGTVLQGHYRLVKVLGQGGFGRTYLAEDQGRFNERCVVKEFIPVQGDTYALEKSKELFQREAATLYQIEHPQIPRFRATFEQGRRLFFVQDFVEGKTYSKLLEERMEQAQAFSEQEIIHLLQQMLPILAYIHGKGIIHRDISPDNIMLRERDRLPVLIDFGVVKEIASQVQGAAGQVTQGTTVGKLGFAPSEQLQTGKAYPNSDLYALAVTCVVLLTGQSPQSMLDETTLTWHWHHRVPSLSPLLIQLINKMLSPKPTNRYQSATEVAQTLRSLTGLVQPAIAPDSKPTTLQGGATNITGKAGASVQPVRRPTATRPAPPPPRRQSNPWLGWSLGIGAFLLLAFTPWFFINSILKDSSVKKSPSPVATETVTFGPAPGNSPTPPPTQSPSESPSATPSPIVETESLNVPPNQAKVQASGRTAMGKVKRYLINGRDGQVLTVAILKGAVTLDIRYPGGEPVEGATGVGSWQSPALTRVGDYQIDVIAARETDFTLEIGVQTPNPTLPSNPTLPESPSPSFPPTSEPSASPAPSN